MGSKLNNVMVSSQKITLWKLLREKKDLFEHFFIFNVDNPLSGRNVTLWSKLLKPEGLIWRKLKERKKKKKVFFVKGNKKLSYLKVFLLGADQPTNQPTNLVGEF